MPSPRRDRDVCASQSGGAINNDGGSLEVNISFFGNNTAGGEGEAVLLSSSTDSAIISDSTFAKGNATYDDGDAFIFTNGVTIDYGTCTGGTNPGEPGLNIFVSDGDFTGCPFRCPKSTYGPGGATSDLRRIESACGLGCLSCPAGATCSLPGLPAPEWCEPGHYNPDNGTQTDGCRECERCEPRMCPRRTASPVR